MSKIESSFLESTQYNGTLPQELAHYISQIVQVDRRTGTLKYSALDSRIRPQVFETAVKIAQAKFFFGLPTELQPTVTIGASSSGDSFATHASRSLDIPQCIVSRIDNGNIDKPKVKAWYAPDNRALIDGIPNECEGFTNTFAIRGLEPTDNVAVFYELCKNWTTPVAIEVGLRQLGIQSVHHIILASEDFRNTTKPSGIRMLSKLGLSIFPITRVKEITKQGQVRVTYCR